MGYDAGILNDFGGGDVQWWHDYIRSLLGLSDDYWQDEIGRYENDAADLQAENKRLENLIKEFVLANPDGCWRKCWNCGETQIHRESVTSGVLCRYCGSQDTRLLKKETQKLFNNSLDTPK